MDHWCYHSLGLASVENVAAVNAVQAAADLHCAAAAAEEATGTVAVQHTGVVEGCKTAGAHTGT